MILIVKQIDFLHSVASRLDHPNDNGNFSRGTWMLSALFCCAFIPLILNYVSLSKFQTLVAVGAPSLLLAYVYTRTRRNSLSSMRGAIEFPVVPKVKFVAFVYFMLAIIGAILVGKFHPWAAPLVPLLISLLPWNRIAKVGTAL